MVKHELELPRFANFNEEQFLQERWTISLKDIIHKKKINNQDGRPGSENFDDREEIYWMHTKSDNEKILRVKRSILMFQGKECNMLCFTDITDQQKLQ